MQWIFIKGDLKFDGEYSRDGKGTQYQKFVVKCKALDKHQRKVVTNYTCFSYLKNMPLLKAGDTVCVSGKLTLGIQYDDDNNPHPLATVLVYQFSIDSREEDN